jgi:hypothetical protein
MEEGCLCGKIVEDDLNVKWGGSQADESKISTIIVNSPPAARA